MISSESATPSSVSAFSTIHVDVGGDGIAWIELNRPDSGNSRNQVMRSELVDAYGLLERDESVRVLVITGVGRRFFCAGMDLNELGSEESLYERRERLLGSRDIEVLASFPKPTLAAINGFALGGGLEMALACDIRIMSADAVLGFPEVQHGLIPGGGGIQRLTRLVGLQHALDVIYRGRQVASTEAESLGIVMKVVSKAKLRSSATAIGRDIARHPIEALRAIKSAALDSQSLPLTSAINSDLDRLLFLISSRNGREAVPEE